MVGATVSGRNHVDLQNIIGLFINTLPIRNYPKKEYRFEEFLEQVKENTFKAYENQNYQYGDLLEKLDVGGDVSRNPLFDVELIIQNVEGTSLTIDQLEFEPLAFEENQAQMDLSFNVMESEKGITVKTIYCTRLYKKETVERFIEFFIQVIDRVTLKPALQLKEISVSPEFEQADSTVFDDADSQFDF